INAQQALNTFSTEGTAGNVTLTSPGNITISSIRSEGREQGGNIRVSSEIGEINSTENIDSFSEQGIGGNIELNAPRNINLANVSSFGATESGDLIIQSQTAQVNTNNVTTQAPAGSSGSIIINGEEVGTGNLRTIGTSSAGEINVEATDGSIRTYDIEISSDGTIGSLTLRATEDINGEDVDITAGEGDANTEIESGGNQNLNDVDINAENDANSNIIAGGNQNIDDVNINAGNNANSNIIAGGNQNLGDVNIDAENDVNSNITAGGNQNLGDVNINAGNDANSNIIAGGNQNLGDVNINAGNDANSNIIAGQNQNINNVDIDAGNQVIDIQNEGINSNINVGNVGNISGIANNNPIINTPINQENSQNNNFTNSTPTNTATPPTTSNLISTTTPSNNDQTKNTATAQEQTESSINNTTETQQILNIIDTVNTTPLTVATGSEQVFTMLEQNRIQEYSDYFGEDFNEKLVNTQNVRDILTNMAAQTGKESAVVYINAYQDQLQVILFTKSGQPILKTIPTVNREKLKLVATQLMIEIINPQNRIFNDYLRPAQQLYKSLIAPISTELETANIQTILFSMDPDFRLLPLAVLHDGEQFLIEKYSMSLIPSVSLMDSRYRSIQDNLVLGMGASEFTEQSPLPAVPLELETISKQLWQGNAFLNEEFTRKNLINERQNYPYPIIHLATHAEFRSGDISQSYIQLWDEKLRLNEVRELGWNNPAVELLVLSACQTAVGSREAELGFAGSAVAMGVKSVLASLWLVSDEATLGLMTEFYSHLGDVNIKAEALREAQLAMLRGEVAIANGVLRGSGSRGELPLPTELANIGNQDFSHPYYWAGFTMVGSPW
ncbi:MAG: CHAT domain-containing protein, partial [Trichodesmium sp.]